MRGEPVPYRFCGGDDGDGHLCWDCTFPLFVHFRESPELCDLVYTCKAHWPRFMLWHGWLPGLSGHTGSPWAIDADEVERAMGSYTPDLICGWVLNDRYDGEEVAESMPDHPNVLSDGCCVTDDLAEVSVAGSGVFSVESGMAWNVRVWAHLDDDQLEGKDGADGVSPFLFCSWLPSVCSAC